MPRLFALHHLVPLLLAACAPKLLPPPPVPAAPTTGMPPSLQRFDRPLPLPAASRADRFRAEAHGAFPTSGRSRLAVAVPVGSLSIPTCPGGPGSARCHAEVRAALMGSLLERGHHVHDAGVVVPPSATIEGGGFTWQVEAAASIDAEAPDDHEKSVSADTSGTATAKVVQSGVEIDDATSLWAGELLGVDKFGGDHFLRVFHIEITPLDLPASKSLEFSREQLASFNALAENWNRERDVWVTQRQRVVQDLTARLNEWAAYEDAHQRWRKENRAAIALFEVPHHPDVRPPLPSIPDVPPRASRETLDVLLQAQPGVIRRFVGTLTVEAVHAPSGEVVWIGKATGEVPATPGGESGFAARLLNAALDAPHTR